MAAVNVDEKLGVNKFFVDEENAHIVLRSAPDMEVFALLERVCPAGLYRRDEQGSPVFDHAGCLECGSCRVLGVESVLERWTYPQGTLGVEYRHG
ncbi:ferredoxin family protein [uncultured Desulfovibrio sp.]|uniref:ferredoxin family protein n=1 Tax=uncultured Desulfovibrio sp. TaxID=167968 RepID=UPI002803801A|nr:ferredoxin family protein [uncultured Desulfovibrio sp.]